jgi:hypothetical protein
MEQRYSAVVKSLLLQRNSDLCISVIQIHLNDAVITNNYGYEEFIIGERFYAGRQIKFANGIDRTRDQSHCCPTKVSSTLDGRM